MRTLALVFFIFVALGFDFTNGFHDSALAVAVSITTRALRPAAALGMAAGLNVVGALVATGVATTVAKGIIAIPDSTHGLVVVFSALVGGIGWNLLTWAQGLPSASTHALIGGLVGAALASSTGVIWHGLLINVVLPMFVSPAIGLALGYVLMLAIMWVFRQGRPALVNRRFRIGQIFSSGAMAFAHGTQDAQKTMGLITLALLTTGHLSHFMIPYWVILAAATAMGLGTLAGGWRIIRTLGNRITPLDPPRAFVAQTAASAVLLASAYGYAMPVSSTHLMTSSVVGAGATRRLSAVRWGTAQQIGFAWLLTLPGAALFAWMTYWIANAIL
ncbi:MAG: inorganic phosphate transporter [Acidimicrobiales bacterium]|nr:inorganic phosphate transporter [Acidimicrobiales bacterium]MBO0892847.1 inorganic phosphate transporter [Acidimicrobiales bacterium]